MSVQPIRQEHHRKSPRGAVVRKPKIEEFQWICRDRPGRFAMQQLTTLNIDTRYQRGPNGSRSKAMAQSWSWAACGVLIVARRPDGSLFIVDGQRRANAASLRADIAELPCMIYDIASVEEEARIFIDCNSNIETMTMASKWRAMLEGRDKIALELQSVCESLGIKVDPAGNTSGTALHCVRVALRLLQDHRPAFLSVLPLAAEICQGESIANEVLGGLVYIEARLNNGDTITHPKWRKRLAAFGRAGLMRTIANTRALYNKGTHKVYAHALLLAVNKGLRVPLVVQGLEGHGNG